MKFRLLLASIFFAAVAMHGATYYVDNVKGSDSNPGTQEKPFASIDKGVKSLALSDRLEVVNNPGVPYVRPYPGVNGKEYAVVAGGTQEKPLVINGNGAVISGLAEIPADRWIEVADNVYRLPFWPMSNMYKNYDKADYWMPDLNIWFVDGESAANALSRQEMEETPNSFWWCRADKAVYFRLPDGKKLDELKIQLPANHGFYTHKDYTVIENFVSIYSWNDGFDTANTATNTVYRNCIAISNCGQGFSCHGDSTAVYDDCFAMNNGSTGITNVHSSQVVYNRSVIVGNVFEAGVFAADKNTTTLNDSLIMDNTPFEQLWAHGTARLVLNNCVVKSATQELPVFFVRNGGLTMNRCTAVGGKFLNDLGKESEAEVILTDCMLGNFKNFTLKVMPERFQLKHNLYFDSPGILYNNKTYGVNEFAQYQADSGRDENSSFVRTLAVNPETGVPDSVDGQGAALPESVWARYRQYKNAKATPTGLIFE